MVADIVGDEDVFVGDDALDGADDGLLADVGGEFGHVVLEVGRGGGQHQCVAAVADLVDVAGEVYAVDVEVDVGEVGGVVTQAQELLDAVVAPHVPVYRFVVDEQQFGQGRGPASAAQNGYVSRKIHGNEMMGCCDTSR